MTSSEYALIPSPPPSSAVDVALDAWLHAKAQASHSARTESAYRETIARFRSLLIKVGIDLDASDPLVVEHHLRYQNALAATEAAHQVTQRVDSNVTAIALAAQAFAAHKDGEGHDPSPNTHNLRLAILSSFYTYVLRQGLFHGANPIARVERRKTQPYAQARSLAHEDLLTLLGAIDQTTAAGLRDYALLLVGLYTGRRLAELAAMSREHITLRRTALEIFWPRCKGGRTMRDTIVRRGASALPAQALIAWLASIDTLYETTEVPLPALVGEEHPIWISLARNGTTGHRLSLQAIGAICERRIGTSKVHTLRHTFARALEDAGAKVSEIQARLGHASLDTTSRYLAQLRADENPHLARLTDVYGLKSLLTPEDVPSE